MTGGASRVGDSGPESTDADPVPGAGVDDAEDTADIADTDDDAGWDEAEDDRTGETLAWLRRKRRAHRRQKARDLAVVVYSLLLAALAYGGGVAVHFLRDLGEAPAHGGLGAGVQRALPAVFAALGIALALVAARDARWRGPVVLPGPAVGWLLAQPVRRAALLRPRLWLSAALAVLPGLLAGLAGAVLLRATGQAALGSALPGLLPAALALPLLGTALGMAVERRAAWAARVRGWTAPAVLLLAALTAQAALAGAGHRFRPLEWAELWSGPWGWAAQPVVRACGGRVPGWPYAVALLAVATAAALLAAHRDAAAVPSARLRARAATAATVASVFWSLELRAAKLAVLDANGGEPALRVHLPAPRGRRTGPWLAVLWRDALALLRAPGRLGKAALWTACGAAAAGLGADLGGARRPVGLVVGLLCGYLAVGALAESARVETDDLRRAAWAPFRLRRLMLLHGVLPAALGVALGALAAVPYAVGGGAGSGWAFLALPVCAPPFAAAALYSACRGPARTQLMFLGGGSPLGGPGPLIYLAWYAAGPLVALTILALALSPFAAHPSATNALHATFLAALLTLTGALATAFSADRLTTRR
jgi:hypothetical protein